jgi:hypothetical protein
MGVFIFVISIFNSVANSSLDQVQKKCFENVNWQLKKCLFKDDPNNYVTSSHLGMSIVNYSYYQFVESLQWGFELSYKSQFPFLESEGGMNRLIIINWINKYFSQKQLSLCQKACVIKCVTANLITYQSDLYSKMAPVKAIYATQIGECTEFARVYEDLSNNFNLPSSQNFSYEMYHAYNKVKLDGDWYYIEPQNDRCEFIADLPSPNMRSYREHYDLERDINLKLENFAVPDNTRVKKLPTKVLSQ